EDHPAQGGGRSVRGVADQRQRRRPLSQPGHPLQSAEQLLPHHERGADHHQRAGQSAGADDHLRVRGQDLRLHRAEGAGEGQGQGEEEAMIRPTRIVFPLLLIAAAMATLFAQTRAKPAASGTSTTGTSGTATATSTTGTGIQQSLQEILEEPSSPDSYHYDPQGRRDPFQSLIGPAPKLKEGQRPAGLAGFLIDEIKLQGIVETR